MKFLGQSMLTLPCHFLRVQQCLFLKEKQSYSRTHGRSWLPSPSPFFKARPSEHPAFCLELCVFLVWAGLGAKSFMPLPVSCFTLTSDDCSILWASSSSPALPLSLNPPKSLEYHVQPYSFSREHGDCCCHPGGKGLWGREKVEIDQ